MRRLTPPRVSNPPQRAALERRGVSSEQLPPSIVSGVPFGGLAAWLLLRPVEPSSGDV